MTAIEIFPWSAGFEVGIPEIDAQHCQLVRLLNLLAGHLAYDIDIPGLNKIFAQLTDYAAYHFETEEKIWQQYLPDDAMLARHRKVHASFIADVIALKQRETDQPLDKVIEEIVCFLTHWLAFHILDRDKQMAEIVLAMQKGASVEQAKIQFDKSKNSGQQLLIETMLAMYENLSTRTLQLMKEIAERQKVEMRLRLFANVFENTLEAICITDAQYHIIDVNSAFCQNSQLEESVLLRKPLQNIKSGFLDKVMSEQIQQSLDQTCHWSGEIWNRTPSGELEPEWLTISAIKNAQGQVCHYAGVFSSVGQLIKRQRHLEHAANHDALTGLPNRLLLADRMELAMADAMRNRCYLAVCYLDLDGFKPVNDHWGHDAGDLVLKIVSQRLTGVMRKNDTVARLGGDEFVILWGDLNDAEYCRGLLQRTIDEIEQPIALDSGTVSVSASIGVTLYPADNVPALTLLLHADHSLYEAKNAGKGCFRFYQN
ncbi:bacteriohemerythrin [Methylomonas sp. LL1]|uniref:bacteriohemerythrin n=1 Tax=Methylomonas sp. LL1 TaxID=2785785 RepID=UPI0018C40CE1|nr:bacteriohemerythrin [Methylomonas sp. LL1]QPK64945.1 bacteriohemerythrin [Methylomonas sp. LL1]